jgi:hypothetical protein
MELSMVSEPEVVVEDYPPMVDPASVPLSSKKYTPKASSKPGKTLLQPESTVKGYPLMVNPASVLYLCPPRNTSEAQVAMLM